MPGFLFRFFIILRLLVRLEVPSNDLDFLNFHEDIPIFGSAFFSWRSSNSKATSRDSLVMYVGIHRGVDCQQSGKYKSPNDTSSSDTYKVLRFLGFSRNFKPWPPILQGQSFKNSLILNITSHWHLFHVFRIESHKKSNFEF